MSHKATQWAFDQPSEFSDMKPAEWAVLMVLADCHNPLKGCFPSQKYIQKMTNIRERSVRMQLQKLRDRKLVNWDERQAQNRTESHRYYLAFEKGFRPAKFAGPTETKDRQKTTKGPAKNDQKDRQNLPPNLVIGTCKGTCKQNAGARDASKFSNSDFEDWYDSYPHKIGKAVARKAFLKLKPQEVSLQQLHSGLKIYIQTKPPERNWCNPATWLNQERWDDEPACETSIRRDGGRSAGGVASGMAQAIENRSRKRQRDEGLYIGNANERRAEAAGDGDMPATRYLSLPGRRKIGGG